MRFDILTIFPEIFESFLKVSLIARARKKNIISVKIHNLRRWTKDAHKTVDDRPYGGGPGMVMMAEPILKAVLALRKIKNQKSKIKSGQTGRASLKSKVIVFSAKGKRFTQADARRLSKYQQLILICGRYEGVDERIAQYIADEEMSIGDYVLFGGEVPAMVVLEAVTRLIPGAIAKEKSVQEESFKEIKGIAKKQLKQFIEYPHYTRPETISIKGKKRSVPKVLLTGNHSKIERWKAEQAKKMTRKRFG